MFLVGMLHSFGRRISTGRDVEEFLGHVLSGDAGFIVMASQAPVVYGKTLTQLAECKLDRELHDAGINRRSVPAPLLRSLQVTKVYASCIGGAEGRATFRRGLKYAQSAIASGVSDPKTRLAIATIVLGVSLATVGAGSALAVVNVSQRLLKTRLGKRLQQSIAANIRVFLEVHGYEPDLVDRVTKPLSEIWDKAVGTRTGKVVLALALPAMGSFVDLVGNLSELGGMLSRSWAAVQNALDFLQNRFPSAWFGYAADRVNSLATQVGGASWVSYKELAADFDVNMWVRATDVWASGTEGPNMTTELAADYVLSCVPREVVEGDGGASFCSLLSEAVGKSNGIGYTSLPGESLNDISALHIGLCGDLSATLF